MKKDFTIVYGYNSKNKNDIALFLQEKFNIELTLTGGDYLSEGYSFFGESNKFDSLRIGDNYLPDDDWWWHKEFKELPTLITFGLTKGKNKEKEEKLEFIKIIMRDNSDITKIELNVFES